MILNSVSAIADLLALAKEIADVEQLPRAAAMHRALAELPRLLNDARQNVRYSPIKRRPAAHLIYSRVKGV